ncbi:phosphatidate cytidylyltransferase [Salinibacterium hongtaonis]|uniref:Phosphatidate cytidylyltransferase n=1 Tax=Homoserinimonas hongtaonis TaxID=2079791 RepID=A0A2U1SZS8_9MICO|nr:phosphatidate cytidylyltransferase [Salinibacterium hongtaonis]AWB89598.1 phosphatidate cytidylyltransferase [Salinibacterium hongtaonis]PWB97043.1 phosphatidate cytidylyltransferase [Salinibacterium hongtaonis]
MAELPDDPNSAPLPPRRRHGRGEIGERAHATADELKAQLEATRAQLEATNERIEAKAGRNLLAATGIGLVLGALLLLSLMVVKELFLVFAGALVAFTSFELASALRFAGRNVPRLPTVVVAVATVPAAFYWGADGKWFVFLGGVAIVVLWRLAEALIPSRRTSAKDLLKDIGASTLVQVYIPFLAGFAVLLTAQDGGEWWTLAFIIAVVAADVGAYASGLTFGRHKMAPNISPAKTWEGFAGAVVATQIAGILLMVLMLGKPWWLGVIFGLALVFTATIGDLVESLIKRDLGIKDISTWLPGHGGFLDRLDSMLPSAAAAYVLFYLFA